MQFRNPGISGLEKFNLGIPGISGMEKIEKDLKNPFFFLSILTKIKSVNKNKKLTQINWQN